MAETTVASRAPGRVRMTIPHGGTALILAAATKIAADHSILAAIITACSGVLVVIIGPFVTDWIRHRRSRHTPVDHTAEHIEELLHVSDHLLGQLEERDTEIEKRDTEIEKLREQLARRRRR